MTSQTMNRHTFLAYGTAATAFTIVSRHVLGGPGHIPPSETIQVAGIGIGGVGHGQIQSVAAQAGTGSPTCVTWTMPMPGKPMTNSPRPRYIVTTAR